MKTIHKFGISRELERTLVEVGYPMLREAPKIVLFGFQQGRPFVWIEHSEDATEKKYYEFKIFPTGVEIPSGYYHVASAFRGIAGEEVYHLYEYK